MGITSYIFSFADTKYRNPLSDFKPVLSDSIGRISDYAETGSYCILIIRIANHIGKEKTHVRERRFGRERLRQCPHSHIRICPALQCSGSGSSGLDGSSAKGMMGKMRFCITFSRRGERKRNQDLVIVSFVKLIK